MPIPRRSISALDFLRACELWGGLTGVGDRIVAPVPVVLLVGSSSASGSYPSLAMRSASSLAFFSASSKSMTSPVTFLAPSFGALLAPSTLFLGPVAADLRSAADVVMRLAAGFASSVDSDLVRGEAERAVSLLPLPALRNGEGVRPTTGGVAVREIGGVGRLMAGLSHEEKKSSSGSPAGVEEPFPSVDSVMTTSSGYLDSGGVSHEGMVG